MYSRFFSTLLLVALGAASVIASFFGTTTPTNTLVVMGGNSAAEADVVQIWGGDPVNRDGFVVRAGVPIFIQRQGTGTSADEKTITFPTAGS